MKNPKKLGRFAVLAFLLGLGLNCLAVRAHAQGAFRSTAKGNEVREQRYGKTVSGPTGLGKACGDFIAVGQHPDGFGGTVVWNRQEKEVFVVAFVNARDDLGVCIAGLKKGDRIQVTSASGIASFKRGGGPLVQSIAALAGAVGTAIAPEAAPAIAAGEKFATSVFGGPTRGMPRDAFGQDPTDGAYEKCEGGICISLPEARGTYYATEGLRNHGPRYDHLRPAHVAHGFFPVREDLKKMVGFLRFETVPGSAERHNTRTLTADGDVHIVAWDSNFDDNQGYYKIVMKITRP
jgi:hypothetical protein